MWKWLDNLYIKDIHDASDGTVVPPHIRGAPIKKQGGMTPRQENDSLVRAERLLFV
jgi:hypothetical protein